MNLKYYEQRGHSVLFQIQEESLEKVRALLYVMSFSSRPVERAVARIYGMDLLEVRKLDGASHSSRLLLPMSYRITDKKVKVHHTQS